MKKLSSMLLFPLVCMFSCKTIKPAAEINSTASQVLPVITEVVPHEVNFSDQTTWLLGFINPVQLTREPHSTWYINGYDDYKVNTEAIDKLNEFTSDELSIKVVMGTWCTDSRREVPRFMRILDEWKFPLAKVTFIGVDDAKLSPVGEYEKLKIQRVPTFIVYKNIIEAGRIIENPVTSLEQDMVKILTGINNNN